MAINAITRSEPDRAIGITFGSAGLRNRRKKCMKLPMITSERVDNLKAEPNHLPAPIHIHTS